MRLDRLLHQTPQETPSQLIFEHRSHLEDSSVSYAVCNFIHLPERHDPQIEIGIPFGGASFQATWQTRSGQRKTQHVRVGQVCVLPANMPHEVTLTKPQETIVINFAPTFIESIADELVGKKVEIIEQWAAHDPLIRQLGIELRKEFQQQSSRRLYVDSVIQVLANHLVRNYSADRIVYRDFADKLPPQKLQQAIEYIHERVERDITLSEIANTVDMSQYRFARAFKQSTGLPPHQYVLLQRIERAKKLLTETRLSIADISYQLGFASQSHFAATFRRFTSVTPRRMTANSS